MDLSGAPTLTRNEKLVMRSSERKDIFAEKFANIPSQQGWGSSAPGSKPVPQHKSTNSNDSYSSFEEGILLRGKDREKHFADESRGRKRENHRMDRTDVESTSTSQPSSYTQNSPSDSSFSLGGSAVWVGDESGLDLVPKEKAETSSVASLVATSTLVGSSRNRRSTDASASSSSSHAPGKDQTYRQQQPQHAYNDFHRRNGVVKDTHFYNTTVAYKDHQLPIKMPLSTFPEEVGDVSNFFAFSFSIT